MKRLCFVCGSRNISHDMSVDAEEELYDMQGIVHDWHCRSCGARMTVFEPLRKSIKGEYKVEQISHDIADDFLKQHHYLAQQGNGFLGKVHYGLFTKTNHIVGVIVFAGISVVETLIGAFEGFERFSDQSGFWELTRLSMDDELKEPNLTSWFVAHAIRDLRKTQYVRAIISYADSRYHHGYIYQATNFKYYGLTAAKREFFEQLEGGEERLVWRGSVKDLKGEWRDRSRKHRYMLVYDKSLKIKWEEENYPKGDNDECELKAATSQLNIFNYLS